MPPKKSSRLSRQTDASSASKRRSNEPSLETTVRLSQKSTRNSLTQKNGEVFAFLETLSRLLLRTQIKQRTRRRRTNAASTDAVRAREDDDQRVSRRRTNAATTAPARPGEVKEQRAKR